MLLQELRDLDRVLLMSLHSNGQRRSATQDKPRVERADNPTKMYLSFKVDFLKTGLFNLSIFVFN